ncbi:MAG: hypothetical protein AVDCRST_MAG26-2754, partial [uncultured Chloroflexia bacterium]
ARIPGGFHTILSRISCWFRYNAAHPQLRREVFMDCVL